jgi:hypothetical protein
MKYAAVALACLLGLAFAQEEEEKPPQEGEAGEEGAEGEEGGEKKPPEEKPGDPKQILADLILANHGKNVTGVDMAARAALIWARSPKDTSDEAKAAEVEAKIEEIGKELTDSVKVVKGNYGSLLIIVEALGELRSKAGVRTLKRFAFQKRLKDESEQKIQAAALIGVGRIADPRDLKEFEEASKSENAEIAKAAYEAFGQYATAKAKVRKDCAETLMKRMEMEFPSSGGGGQGGGGGVSKEKQERWAELSPAMIGSMKAVCRQPTINDMPNWREWWKENKKKPWKDDDES